MCADVGNGSSGQHLGAAEKKVGFKEIGGGRGRKEHREWMC